MASDIIDNRRERLADRVRDLLDEGAICARFAVGYLFLEGLAPLRAQLEHLQDIQFLIGNVVNRLTEEQVREEAISRLRSDEVQAFAPVREQENMAVALRQAHTRAATVTALNLRRTIQEMPRNTDCQELLLCLASRIANGTLKVRLYTQERLHAKLSLLEYPNDRLLAIVGSSNLTLGGAACPTEMNVIVKERNSVRELKEWYEGLWDNSQDFHRELFEELGQCWAMMPLAALATEVRE